MQSASIPNNEQERLAALQRYDVLDTLPEQAYDDITYIASQICGTPIALMSLVDADRQWFKSKVGLDANETHRDVAFCAHAILQPSELFVVEDTTADTRFADNPLVLSDPSIRFYAGAPLVTPNGMPLGTLCVIDRQTRQLDEHQAKTLAALARQVIAQLELSKTVEQLSETTQALQQANQQLANSNRDLESFAYIAAHDLKEPLRMISSFTDLLSLSLTDKLTAEEQEFFAHIEDGAKRGKALTDAILQYAKLEQQADTFESISLSDVVESAAKTAMHSYPHGHVVWDTCDASLYSNGQLLEHLLSNLITNGLKYNKNERPTVQVKINQQPNHIELTVQDNGIGIAASMQHKVFDMFSRGHGRTEYEGTGIGLAVCRRVMELHGGSINLHSEPGLGSTFSCVFPNNALQEKDHGSHQYSVG